jgi:hypothetical protein
MKHMGQGTVVAFDERTRTAIEELLAAVAPNRGATATDYVADVRGIERGVQQARKAGPAMGRVLPRKAVHKNTWSKILTLLGPVHCAENCCKDDKAKPAAST